MIHYLFYRNTTFMFAFKLATEDFDILTDETYLDMTVAQYNNTKNGKYFRCDLSFKAILI